MITLKRFNVLFLRVRRRREMLLLMMNMYDVAGKPMCQKIE
jgi:hypothetical protein